MVAIREVAQRAGVSKMSVSRVLNDSPLVHEATRERVLRAMAELNYMPSAPARSLKRGRTTLLGVLLPDSNNPIYNLYVDGVKDSAYAAGYSVVSYKMGSAANEEYLRLLYEQRVAGVIITYAGWQDSVPSLLGAGIEVVSIDHRAPACDRVTIDNVAAIGRAVAHLAGLGHRRIGMITGPLHTRSESERLVGYRRAMRRLGLPLERRLQVVAAGFSDADGMAAARALLAGRERPSALVVSSSALTPGVLVEIGARGLRLPEDVALVGVGEMSWTPALVSPVTSLVEPAYAMGAQACHLLMERVAKRYIGPARRLYHPTRLAVRLSCGAPIKARDSAMRAPYLTLFHHAAPAGAGHEPAPQPAAPPNNGDATASRLGKLT